MGRKSTSIERKVSSYLKTLGVYYRREYRIETYPVDFLVSPNFVIQTDGCWYHGCSKCYKYEELSSQQKMQKYRDKANVGLLTYKGYKVLRLPECEINDEEGWIKVQDKIKDFLELNVND